MDARVTCLYSAATETGTGADALTGFGYVIAVGESEQTVAGSCEPRQGDLLRGHLQALVLGLKALMQQAPSGGRDSVLLVLDHEYLQKGLDEWMPNWKRNGWRNAKKQPVANADLWKEADALIEALKARTNGDVLNWKGSYGEKALYKKACNVATDACMNEILAGKAQSGPFVTVCVDRAMNDAIAGKVQVPAMTVHANGQAVTVEDVPEFKDWGPKGYDGLQSAAQRAERDAAIAASAKYMAETGKLPWEA